MTHHSPRQAGFGQVRMARVFGVPRSRGQGKLCIAACRLKAGLRTRCFFNDCIIPAIRVIHGFLLSIRVNSCPFVVVLA
jgi:hypothetical protein